MNMYYIQRKELKFQPTAFDSHCSDNRTLAITLHHPRVHSYIETRTGPGVNVGLK